MENMKRVVDHSYTFNQWDLQCIIAKYLQCKYDNTAVIPQNIIIRQDPDKIHNVMATARWREEAYSEDISDWA